MANDPVTITELLQPTNQARNELLMHMRNGTTIRRAATICGVSLEKIYKLLKLDPLFKQDWDEARKNAADTLADDLLDVFDGAETVADAMIGKAKSDNIAKSVAWRNPRTYGNKINIDVTHTVDLTKALRQAEQRTLPILEQAAIENQANLSDEGNESIPPVDERHLAPRNLNDNNDFKIASKIGVFHNPNHQIYYNRDGSIKPVGPSGRPTGRPLGSKNKAQLDTHVQVRDLLSDADKLRAMARAQAERDNAIEIDMDPRPSIDMDMVSRVLGIEDEEQAVERDCKKTTIIMSEMPPAPIEQTDVPPDTMAATAIDAACRVPGIEQETSAAEPTCQVDADKKE